MDASRRIVVLATLVAVVGAFVAGAANAEPKNMSPFTRPVDARVLVQVVRTASATDLAPVPEAKNELPFTRVVGTATGSTSTGGTNGTFALGGGSSGGVDWALVGWVLAAAVTVGGGTAVALSHARLSPRTR